MARAVSSARPRTSLDDWQSDGPSLGGMLGGSSNGARGSGSAPPPMDVNDVPLNSEVGVWDTGEHPEALRWVCMEHC